MHWTKKPDLEPSEQVVATKAANHTRGSTAVGGRLIVTNRRLIFTPNAFESLLRRRPWSISTDQVVGVGVESASLTHAGGGGLRKRLRVRTADGEELFLVNKLDQLLRQLNEIGLPVDSAP